MNSTDFFQKHLLPRRKEYFPTGFDTTADSYWTTRKNPRMTLKMFELGSAMTPDRLAQTLSHYWAESGDKELLPLAKPLAELARSVYSIEDQNEEVSPFIYVMY